MTQHDAEARVRGLQKQFLSWVEHHPVLQDLDPRHFEDIRRRVFRSTFFAFRLGVVGVDVEAPENLFQRFFGWMSEHPALRSYHHAVVDQISERAFRTVLDAFRTGAQVGSDEIQHR